MKLIYPVCVYHNEGSGGYRVVFPNIPECVAEGDTLADAIMNGIDAASEKVLDYLENGKTYPKPGALEDVVAENNGFVNLLMLDLNAYSDKSGRVVRKALNMPLWLDIFAESYQINISNVLQDALTSIYEKQDHYDEDYVPDNVVRMARG